MGDGGGAGYCYRAHHRLLADLEQSSYTPPSPQKYLRHICIATLLSDLMYTNGSFFYLAMV